MLRSLKSSGAARDGTHGRQTGAARTLPCNHAISPRASRGDRHALDGGVPGTTGKYGIQLLKRLLKSRGIKYTKEDTKEALAIDLYALVEETTCVRGWRAWFALCE